MIRMMSFSSSVFCFFLILLVLLGCAKLTTTSSNLNIESSDLEKIDAIVNASFLGVGYEKRGTCSEGETCLYVTRKYKEGYPFYVTYKRIAEQIVILIKYNFTKANEYRIAKTDEYLTQITKQIKNKLENANIEAVVETKTDWTLIIE